MRRLGHRRTASDGKHVHIILKGASVKRLSSQVRAQHAYGLATNHAKGAARTHKGDHPFLLLPFTSTPIHGILHKAFCTPATLIIAPLDDHPSVGDEGLGEEDVEPVQ